MASYICIINIGSIGDLLSTQEDFLNNEAPEIKKHDKVALMEIRAAFNEYSDKVKAIADRVQKEGCNCEHCINSKSKRN